MRLFLFLMIGCSPGCANCDDKFTCFDCLDGMFLKNNAECVEDCGPDYYSNPVKRLCEGKCIRLIPPSSSLIR